MPYSAETFRSKHNHKLKGAAASKAAEMATAMEREGVDPGVAIATASKHGNKMMRRYGGQEVMADKKHKWKKAEGAKADAEKGKPAADKDAKVDRTKIAAMRYSPKRAIRG